MKWKVAVPGSYVKPTGLVHSRICLNLTSSILWWSWMSHWITENSFIFPNCENEPANNQAKKNYEHLSSVYWWSRCRFQTWIFRSTKTGSTRRSHLGDGLHSPWFFLGGEQDGAHRREQDLKGDLCIAKSWKSAISQVVQVGFEVKGPKRIFTRVDCESLQ